MSLTTPTTQQITDNIIAQLEASLNQSIPLLPKSFLRVLARTMGGVFILLYKYVGFMHLQQFVRHASFAPTTINGVTVTPLIEWGRLVGVGDPTPSTAAELTVSVSVQGSGLGGLNVGAQLVNAATGVNYVTTRAYLLDTATVAVNVRAASDQQGGDGSGNVGNMAPGGKLLFANPLEGVAREATVTAIAVNGSDGETEGAYRQRVIDRFQKRPQGGAYADYEQWGEETPGVTNVYPYASPNPGQVDVYVEATVSSSGNADGIPTNAQLRAVLKNINYDKSGLASRRPVGALVNALPITRAAFGVTVSGVQADNIVDTRAQITAAIEQYFLSREPYILGLSVLPRLDRVTRSALGGVVDDIVSARGGIFTDVTLKLNGTPVDLYTLAVGQKAKANTVVFL